MSLINDRILYKRRPLYHSIIADDTTICIGRMVRDRLITVMKSIMYARAYTWRAQKDWPREIKRTREFRTIDMNTNVFDYYWRRLFEISPLFCFDVTIIRAWRSNPSICIDYIFFTASSTGTRRNSYSPARRGRLFGIPTPVRKKSSHLHRVAFGEENA